MAIYSSKKERQKARVKRRWKRRVVKNRKKGGYYETGVGSLGYRLKQLGYKDYSSYLASPHWKELRSRLILATTTCGACTRNSAKALHHQTYERFGAELDQDLIPVCSDCHRRIHQSERHNGSAGLEGALKRIMRNNRKRENRRQKQQGM
jgi:hypothetical protein